MAILVTAVSGGDFQRWLGKGVSFSKWGQGVLKSPYLLGGRANFEGLVMVRLKVSKF
jgi:hypothetical protein